MDVGNLISGSSAFSESNLNTWKFSVHILLKPHLEKMSIILIAVEMTATTQQSGHSLDLRPPSKGLTPAPLYSLPPTPWQVTVDPHLRRGLLGPHRQVWPSFLWGHCSFLLDLGVHKVLFVPSKNLALQEL